MKKRKGIPKKDYQFDTAGVYGNCCWKVWDRYKGGRPLQWSPVNVYHESRWVIRAIEVERNCDLD